MSKEALVQLRFALLTANQQLKATGYDPDHMGTIDLDPGVNELLGRRNALQEAVELLADDCDWEARARTAEADLEAVQKGLKDKTLDPIEARASWLINERAFLRDEKERFDAFRQKLSEGKGALDPDRLEDICKEDPGYGTIQTDEAFGPTRQQIMDAVRIQHRFDTNRVLKAINSNALFEKACVTWMAVSGEDGPIPSDFRHNMGHLFTDVLRPELISVMTDQSYDPGVLDMEPRFKALEELVQQYGGALDCWYNGYGAGALDSLRVLQGRPPLRMGLPLAEPDDSECPATPEFLDAWEKGETFGDNESLNLATLAKTTAWLAKKGK